MIEPRSLKDNRPLRDEEVSAIMYKAMSQPEHHKANNIIHKATPEESKAFQRSYYAKKAVKVHKLNAQVKGGKLVIRMGL